LELLFNLQVTSGVWGTIPKLAVCTGFQLLVALPFLQENWSVVARFVF
jgi:hypothetical protein